MKFNFYKYTLNLQISKIALVLLIFGVVFSCSYCHEKSDDLILGSRSICDYQVILPERANEALVRSAELIKEAFAANGFEISVVSEDKDDPSRPGIYLGDTKLAKTNGIDPSQFNDWSYLFRVIGKDLIITGSNGDRRFGIVKGACDFLREYVGTRFLYPGKTGIEFLNTPVISIPANLDLIKNPMLKFNFSNNWYPEEELYNMANNHFTCQSKFKIHTYQKAIPFEEYFNTHPEYFALIDGKRLDRAVKSQYCISNPKVKELFIQYMIRNADQGNEIVTLAQADGFRIRCECEECREFYGTGDDWDEKIWLFHREIAEQFQKERPDTKVLMLSYQATTHPPKSFRKFPDNTMIMLCHNYEEALEEWSESEVHVPCGFTTYTEQFAIHHFTTYLPKRGPYWLEAQVKRFFKHNIVGSNPDAGIYCYGLEGPSYYAWGRMIDDPENNRVEYLLEEYYTAAFGEAVDPMRRFFSILHEEVEFFSQWLSPRSPTHFRVPIDGEKPARVDDPLDWVRVPSARFGSRGMHRGISDPGQALSLIYTPDMVLGMEQELQQAVARASDKKVKQRLSLISMELDYLKNIGTVNCLYNAYRIHPDQTCLDRLLKAIDTWNAMLDSFYDNEGNMKPVSGWPELRPFRNDDRGRLGLVTARWWARKQKDENPFAWDTKIMRVALEKDLIE